MVEIIIPTLYLLTGACCYASFTHFSAGVQQSFDYSQIFYGYTGLSVILLSLFHVKTLQAETMDEFVFGLKGSITFAILSLCNVFWFIALYTKKVPLALSPNHCHWFEHLKELGLPGQNIVVEITEGLLMEAKEEIYSHLLSFRDKGIQVALDDFGTGYSLLAYLKRFDIDFIKIDQTFVRNLTPASDDLALCEAMVVMAHKLGLKVIAEGVETELQRDLLKQMCCDYGQGYLFSRPVPAEDFERLLGPHDGI
jgi:hypothetical protein